MTAPQGYRWQMTIFLEWWTSPWDILISFSAMALNHSIFCETNNWEFVFQNSAIYCKISFFMLWYFKRIILCQTKVFDLRTYFFDSFHSLVSDFCKMFAKHVKIINYNKQNLGFWIPKSVFIHQKLRNNLRNKILKVSTHGSYQDLRIRNLQNHSMKINISSTYVEKFKIF